MLFLIIQDGRLYCSIKRSIRFTGSGTTFATGDKGKKFVYMSGTDLVEIVTGTVTASSTTTFTNKTFTAPKYADGGYVADANGNENLVWGTTGSAVNEFKIANAATGNGPTLSSVSTSGTDSNIDINITPSRNRRCCSSRRYRKSWRLRQQQLL